MFFILISTISFCLETLPQFKDNVDELGLSKNNSEVVIEPKKQWDPTRKSFPFWVTGQGCQRSAYNSVITGLLYNIPVCRVEYRYLYFRTQNDLSLFIESICIAFFTFEFAARFFTCPAKCAFMKEIGNLIDILAVIPYYFSLGVEIIFMKLNESSEHVSNASEKVAFLALLRIIRILRNDEKIIYLLFKPGNNMNSVASSTQEFRKFDG